MNFKNIAALSTIALAATFIFTPTPAKAMTGEEVIKVIRVFSDYMENIQKIFQPIPTAPQPDDRIPNPGTDEPQPEPDTIEYQFN
ncbi:hypothetical protein [Chamaesiphon sp.]|uniref:hypothetical protein n=1 Tax=Chamaesiphon sp. TaxID=2814140 RepID=UPI0035939688